MLTIRDGKISVYKQKGENGYSNAAEEYLPEAEHRTALFIWLARQWDGFQSVGEIAEDLKRLASQHYTAQLIDALFPSCQSIDMFLEEAEDILAQKRPTLSADDIFGIFSSVQATGAIDEGATAVVSNATTEHADILAAIRAKPFVLLAGISGTGKSRLVRQLARRFCPKESELWNAQRPGNYEMIQVRPNWHDSTDLMGYVTRITEDKQPRYVLTDFVRFLAKAWLYPEVPFFLCLDEMNLAPVEQYFAEYLSVIETRSKNGSEDIATDVLVKFSPETKERAINELLALYEPTTPGFAKEEVQRLRDMWMSEGVLRIPPNFIVMGTVNMDETTFSFSRKVLDRAMSFELNEVDMDGGLQPNSMDACDSINPAAAKCEFTEGCEVYAVAKDDCGKIKGYLSGVNKVLDKTPFKIAYRTRNEIMIYCHERAKDAVSLAQALDEATSMKILSRVEGDKRRLVVRDEDLPEYNGKGLLESLLDAILKGLKTVRGGDEDYTESGVCSGKLKEMMSQLESGYTSFWTR